MGKLLAALAAFAVLLGIFTSVWFYAFSKSPGGGTTTAAANAITSASLQRGHLVAAVLCLLLIVAIWVFLYRGRQDFGAVQFENDPVRAPILGLVATLALIAFGLCLPAVQESVNMMLRETTYICRMILVIMVLGLAGNAWQVFTLRREHRAFQAVKGLSTPLDRGDPELPHKLERIFNLHAAGALAEKWRNLKAAAAYSDLADYETLMAFPDQREFLRESRISFVIKILPLMGLLGTVVGFVMAVVGMQQAATKMSDFNAFKDSMLSSLDGMSSAFLTTLAGIAAMLLVMFVNVLVAEARNRVMLLEDEHLYLSVYLPWRRLLGERPK